MVDGVGGGSVPARGDGDDRPESAQQRPDAEEQMAGKVDRLEDRGKGCWQHSATGRRRAYKGRVSENREGTDHFLNKVLVVTGIGRVAATKNDQSRDEVTGTTDGRQGFDRAKELLVASEGTFSGTTLQDTSCSGAPICSGAPVGKVEEEAASTALQGAGCSGTSVCSGAPVGKVEEEAASAALDREQRALPSRG